MLVKTNGHINPPPALLTYDDLQKPIYYLNDTFFCFLSHLYHLLLF